MNSPLVLRHPSLTALRAPTAGSGVLLGLACAGAVVVGPGYVMVVALLAAVAIGEWAMAGPGEAERLRGLGVGALVGLAAAKGLFFPLPWQAALPFATAPLALVALDARLIGRRWRSGAAASALLIAGLASANIALTLS